MKIAVLGTGIVGRALAGKLAEVGNDVTVGTRDVDAGPRRARLPRRSDFQRLARGAPGGRARADAKRQVGELLESFGWPVEHIRDLGGIGSARGTEMYVALWVRLWGALGTADFNIRVVR
jgi:nucleoside-diphosphate-sugar epimerase